MTPMSVPAPRNHIRCDLGNGVMGALNGASSSAKVEQVFDSATYASYGFGVSNDFIQAFRTSHMFLEPCFTHRWNKIPVPAICRTT